MQPLHLPPFAIKLSGSKQHPQVFDILRRKYVALTPEEWVRQHFVHFLIEHKHYPPTLLGNEIQLRIGSKILRADSVLYDRQLHPLAIMEYKAPHVAITQRVFDQILAYNTLLGAPYLMVSNGLEHYACKLNTKSKKYLYLRDIPDYSEIETK